ncbi:hypothetical protein SAMN05421770_104161 [Granulicella rosea]|uniref:Uncharacterized protein n=1 Tax=Granulicella rosea TaxID=474952 RepID=A0A239JVP1_9BACT|nr:hypothetical protein SAMN05421770_104161 [Granulicella rosea]
MFYRLQKEEGSVAFSSRSRADEAGAVCPLTAKDRYTRDGRR